MVKQDLIEKSAVRNFEKSLGGGIKAGEIGVIASKKGLGKTLSSFSLVSINCFKDLLWFMSPLISRLTM